MGERDGGFYVARETIDVIGRHLVAEADIPTAQYLRARPSGRLPDPQAERCNQRKPGLAAAGPAGFDRGCDEFDREDGPRERIEALASGRWWSVSMLGAAPRSARHGAGDLFAALFLGHYVKPPRSALGIAKGHGFDPCRLQRLDRPAGTGPGLPVSISWPMRPRWPKSRKID